MNEEEMGTGNKFYILTRDGGEPIEMTLKGSTELKIEKRKTIEPGEWKPEEKLISFELKCSRKGYKEMKRKMLRTERFDRQCLSIQSNPEHYRKVYRCMLYGDQVPRKVARRYPDFIRWMKLAFMAGCFSYKPTIIGIKC